MRCPWAQAAARVASSDFSSWCIFPRRCRYLSVLRARRTPAAHRGATLQPCHFPLEVSLSGDKGPWQVLPLRRVPREWA